MRQIALDTETTGLTCHDGHKIIEIGCVEIINRQITSNIYNTHINPKRKIDIEAKKITGLTEDFLKDKPVFSQIAHDFYNFLKGADQIIVHNANFDINFINNEFKLMNFEITNLRKIFNILDTLEYARKIHPGKSNSLNSLCKRYNVYNKHRMKHTAIIDANLLAKVYLKMTSTQLKVETSEEHVKTDYLINNIKTYMFRAKSNEMQKHIKYIKKMQNE